MSQSLGEQARRKLNEAEGYLDLELPHHALRILESRSDWSNLMFEASLIKGEALRRLERFREAIDPLEMAASLSPGDSRVALALGWCYKRTNRLAQAIDCLDRAERHDPENALLHYNLACYWSLAGNEGRAMTALHAALQLEPKLRSRLAGEPDFFRLRGNPTFEQLCLDSAPRK